jgi:hypothetical protein
MDLKFKDLDHAKAYEEFITRARVSKTDMERHSLFYVLALFGETRNHINDVYNFDDNCIEFEGLNKGWQTGGTTKATKLAFNLYNNFRGVEPGEDYSPLELFSVSEEYRNYLLYAVQIRFS